jgi:hypothetical protein
MEKRLCQSFQPLPAVCKKSHGKKRYFDQITVRNPLSGQRFCHFQRNACKKNRKLKTFQPLSWFRSVEVPHRKMQLYRWQIVATKIRMANAFYKKTFIALVTWPAIICNHLHKNQRGMTLTEKFLRPLISLV